MFPPGAEIDGLNLKSKVGPYVEKSDMSPPCGSCKFVAAPVWGKDTVMLVPAANCLTS